MKRIYPRKRDPVDIDFTLRRVFNKSNFRPLQRDVIVAALEGHDVFIQAATSFGKSLCFQLPAVVDHGITIVVSPLLALMNNQIAALVAAKINAAAVNSTTPIDEKQQIMTDLRTGHPRTRLLYVTPEYCALDSFRKTLRFIHSQGQLSRIAIDEAHCISEWGHDFRPQFKELSFFKKQFPDVPMICLTATATQRVRDDIVATVGLDANTLKYFTMTTSRPNLHYEVRFKSDDADHYDDFLDWLREVHARRSASATRSAEIVAAKKRLDNVSGIIYTRYRSDCEAVASRLTEDGIGAKPFHAGLTNQQKADYLQGWVENRAGYDVMVATTAFGMGIDKDNVRFVVHWQLPKSFEGYYQEAGRAGRDSKASLCIMYYSREDRDRAMTMLSRDLEKKRSANQGFTTASGRNGHGQAAPGSGEMMMRAKSLQALIGYCESTSECRHRAICGYFGEKLSARDVVCDFACDYCKDRAALVRRKDKGLASEEWCSTQRETGAYDEYYD